MSIENDPEPERYYSWMLWKLRQNRREREMPDIDKINKEIAEFHEWEDDSIDRVSSQEDEAWRHKEMMSIGMFDVNPDWIDLSDKEEQYLERTIEILEENITLMRKKSSDYNNGIPDKEYYPFGYKSFYTILITKLLRYKSVMEQDSVNYESASDSLRDLINYAARAIVYHEREGK